MAVISGNYTQSSANIFPRIRQSTVCIWSVDLLVTELTADRTANTLNTTIRDVHVPTLSDVEFEGQRISPPMSLSWYFALKLSGLAHSVWKGTQMDWHGSLMFRKKFCENSPNLRSFIHSLFLKQRRYVPFRKFFREAHSICSGEYLETGGCEYVASLVFGRSTASQSGLPFVL